jgi:hypothetical protein
MIFFKSIKLAIFYENKKAGSSQFDKRKKKKLAPLTFLLIEHLTEKSNWHITLALKQIKIFCKVLVNYLNAKLILIHAFFFNNWFREIVKILNNRN